MIEFRKSAICVAAIPLLFALACTPVRAADHRDSPTADGTSEGDITDFFSFLDPNDASKIVLIMNVNPFAVPGESSSYRFSHELLYQFKIDNTGDAKEDTVVQVVFSDTPSCASGQSLAVYGPGTPIRPGAKNILIGGIPTVTGCTNTILQDNNVQVFTGLRDDPFVFDFAQFSRILNGSQDVFRDLPTTPLGHLRGRALHSDGTSGVDVFGGFNVSSIAIEFPKSMATTRASLIYTWATVSMASGTDHVGDIAYKQFQRMGQQAFKTVFVPAANREQFNASVPENDMTNWSYLIPDALTSTDSTGDTIAARYDLLNSLGLFSAGAGAPALLPRTFTNTNASLLRVATIPDVQRLDLAADPNNLEIGVNGLQNGRRPGDDAVDILVRLVRQLADIDFMGSGATGKLQFPLQNLALPITDRRVLVVLQGTDFIRPDSTLSDLTQSGNDQPLLTEFPFLALPHPVPGAAGTVGYPVQQ
ncbi:MAG TPA: DUF4331 family protein [Bryobacteraceae bacterium]|nr:DUF4331 family protein [Bryobacteraceae bacterium]